MLYYYILYVSLCYYNYLLLIALLMRAFIYWFLDYYCFPHRDGISVFASIALKCLRLKESRRQHMSPIYVNAGVYVPLTCLWTCVVQHAPVDT